MKKKTILRAQTNVPLYPVQLYLRVTEDIVLERIRMVTEFGPLDKGCQLYAGSLCSYLHGRIGLFFEPDTTIASIAHEIYHATNRIMEFIGCKHSHKYSEEAYAYLLAWITEWVTQKWPQTKRII